MTERPPNQAMEPTGLTVATCRNRRCAGGSSPTRYTSSFQLHNKGAAGGRVVAMGPPTEILGAKRSHTARYLREVLNGNGRRARVSHLKPWRRRLPVEEIESGLRLNRKRQRQLMPIHPL